MLMNINWTRLYNPKRMIYIECQICNYKLQCSQKRTEIYTQVFTCPCTAFSVRIKTIHRYSKPKKQVEAIYIKPIGWLKYYIKEDKTVEYIGSDNKDYRIPAHWTVNQIKQFVMLL